MGQNALIADIEQMFHQLKVREVIKMLFEAKAVECVKKDFYMDDFFKSNDSEKIFANIVKRTN